MANTQLYSLVIDGAFAVTIFMIVFTCYKRGLLASVIKLFGLVASCLAAGFLSSPVAESIYNGAIKEKVITFISEYLPQGAEDAAAGLSGSALAEYVSGLLDSLASSEAVANIPFLKNILDNPQLEQQIVDKAGELGGNISEAISGGIIEPAILFIIKGIAFVVIFSLAMLIMKILFKACLTLNHIPLIGGVNRLLGTAVGVITAFVAIYALAIILNMLVSVSGGSWQILNYETLNGSVIYSWLYGLNFSPMHSFLAAV